MEWESSQQEEKGQEKFRPRSEKARAVRTGGEERIWKEVKGNKIVRVSQALKFNTKTLRPLMRKRSKILHKIKKNEWEILPLAS